jgi:hypothetical protein
MISREIIAVYCKNHSKPQILSPFLLVWPLLPTHYTCRGLLHLITFGWTPLDEGSACRRGLCLHNIQHSQETNIHALSGIRTRNPSNRAAADQRLRPGGYRDPQILFGQIANSVNVWHTQKTLFFKGLKMRCCTKPFSWYTVYGKACISSSEKRLGLYSTIFIPNVKRYIKTCRYFFVYVFLTVHHSVDLFQLPTSWTIYFFYNNIYIYYILL